MSGFLFTASASLFPLAAQEGFPQVFPLFLAHHLFMHRELGARRGGWAQFLHLFNLLVGSLLAFFLLFVRPPARYPHLFQLFFAQWAFLVFVGTFLWVLVSQVQHFLAQQAEPAEAKKRN